MFPILEYVQDASDFQGDGPIRLINLPEGYSGEVSVFRGSLDFAFYIESRDIISQYMKKDVGLTKKIQDDFEETYDGRSWRNWREKWLIKNKLLDKDKLKVEISGNTYNIDDYHFWGSIFEYTVFDNKKNGAVIMWHHEGDVRGNYSDPEVWIGDFGEFMFSQYMRDPEEEVAYLLGYDGDYETLERDVYWLSLDEEKRQADEDYQEFLRKYEMEMKEEEGQQRFFNKARRCVSK